MVPFAAGGIVDIIARPVAEQIGARWGQPVLVEARPGANGAIAAELVAKAPADGHTWFLTTLSHVVNPAFSKSVPYHPTQDFSAIGMVATVPALAVVHSSVPAQSLKELVALARTQPGKLNYLNPGIGTSMTPLASLRGIITPNGLVFERHHAGVPDIDPAQHRLVIHGLVKGIENGAAQAAQAAKRLASTVINTLRGKQDGFDTHSPSRVMAEMGGYVSEGLAGGIEKSSPKAQKAAGRPLFDPAIVRADRLIKLAGELRIPDGSHLVLCPARFDEDRGQKILVEAMKQLGRDDVFCLLLGSVGVPMPFFQDGAKPKSVTSVWLRVLTLPV